MADSANSLRHAMKKLAMSAPGTIAVIANHEGLDSPALLAAAAADWSTAGARVVGLLARNTSPNETCSAGSLQDIASNGEYSIRLDTPPALTTCHLDVAGMERACAGLLEQIPSADVVVLSKFGKLEAMQRGLWAAFAAAVAAEKPLLTTVSQKHVAALKTFAPTAVWIDARLPAIEEWWRAVAPRHA
jgi:nucleoside-triphosphatase THEP1